MSAFRRSFGGTRLRRARSFAIFTVLVVAGLMWIGSAQAVHDTGMFQLDGNPVNSSSTTPPYDWNNLFDANGNQLITPDPINGPILASAFVKDYAKPDPTYFTSNKDIEPIANWGCTTINNPTAKDDLQNAYAALVQIPNGAPDNAGDQVLYLASERASNNGDSFAGFWLLKDNSVGCSGSGSFTGHHTDGDLLILSNYTNGGGTQDVQVYKWVGNDATGSPVLDASFSGGICGPTLTNDNACAIANSSTVTTPWTPTTHAANTFVETGIDLTQLLGSSGGCFTNFLAETRSSQQLTATLKDFAGGSFSTCVPPTIATTASGNGSSVSIGDSSQTDTATITGVASRPDPTGTMDFFLCNPSQVTSAGCPSGSGTQVGGDVTIVAGSATSAAASGSLISTAGTYCWRSEYTPDSAGSNFYTSASHTDANSECFTVVPNTTQIGTTATSGTIGGAVHDVATLSGATANAGGTITFSAYGPSAQPDCSGDPVYSNTVDVSGPGDYNSGDFTPTTAGSYYWVASYSGDTNNIGSSGSCGDGGETSTIAQQPTAINTTATDATIGAAIHDIATLSGGFNPGGTITFSLYGPSAKPDCSGDPVYTNTVDVSGNGDYNSGDFTPTTAGSYYWVASYSGDVNNIGSSGSCGDDGETSTIAQQPTSINTAATDAAIGDPVHDVATLSGATADAGGTITFNLYGPSETPDCSSEPVYTNTVDVNGPGDYSSGDFTPGTAGSYYWVASYSGDVNNLPSNGNCGDDGETSTVGKQPTNIGTAATSGSLGDAIHDVATLSGGIDVPQGTITFSLYGPSSEPDCSGDPVFTDTESVDGNGDYQSAGFTPTAPGNYYWIASYSGDANNQSSTGSCGDEGETSTIKTPDIQIVKTADAAKVNVGSPIGFTLTVYNDGAGNAHGVKLSDPLPATPGLDWQQPDKQGSGWAGSCAVSGPVGSQVLTCGGSTGKTVPGGTTQTASAFTVHVTSNTTGATGGDCPGSGTISNTGTVTATNNDPTQRQSTATTCVQALVDLSITKTGSPTTQDLGQGNITWTIVVTNHGPSADTGVTVTDPMPGGNTFVSATTTKGTCTGGATLTCNIGNMAAGETVTITLVTKPSTTGAQVNTAMVTGNRPETNTANNSATATVQVTAPITPPVVYCVAVSSVTPKQLFVGRKTKLTIHVTQHGKAKAGVKVLIKGPKFLTRTKPSNAKGLIKQTVKMKKAGALIFTPIASKRCNTKRIGVTGVFTPPVTG
jgi:uncharacterized repeat protein (TIGR01451 family)